jgi:hypothetical protein
MLRSGFVGGFALVILLGTAAQRAPVPETSETRIPLPPPETAPPPPAPLDLDVVVKNIATEATRQQIDDVVARLVAAFSDSTSGQAGDAVAALASLSHQPHLVASLIEYFERLPPAAATRVTTLAIIGELRRVDAAPFLQKVVWAPLPTRESDGERLASRGIEEVVRIKAVHGLAYLRTPEAYRALIDIARRHDSVAVKSAAIDAYMWNHDDSPSAAQTLYAELPSDLHKLVERPRFHAGVDPKQFNERLRAWRDRWAPPQVKP